MSQSAGAVCVCEALRRRLEPKFRSGVCRVCCRRARGLDRWAAALGRIVLCEGVLPRRDHCCRINGSQVLRRITHQGVAVAVKVAISVLVQRARACIEALLAVRLDCGVGLVVDASSVGVLHLLHEAPRAPVSAEGRTRRALPLCSGGVPHILAPVRCAASKRCQAVPG